MNRTKIEWVKNPDGSQGYTWNPITGCLNHVNGLCKGGGFPCYAYKLAHGRLRARYLANKPRVMTSDMSEQFEIANDPFYPRFWPERILPIDIDDRRFLSAISAKPKGIFVCDMGELFGPWVPQSWQEEVFECIKTYPQHRFYLLTKQPQELKKWSPFPENCWVGVTATNQVFWNEALRQLTDVKASVKYASIEPCLGQILPDPYTMQKAQLGWLIIGVQTKPYKPPKIEWVQEIALAATKAHIPLFLKDNLKAVLPSRMPFYDAYTYWSEDRTHTLQEWRLRQEMPGD
jgi:protein gp37